jgi:hypothetical protein
MVFRPLACQISNKVTDKLNMTGKITAVAGLGILMLLTASCALIETRRQQYNSPYGDIKQYREFTTERSTLMRERAALELGLDPYSSLTPEQNVRIQKRILLQGLENKIATQAERTDYFNYKPLMSDEECIEYLSLGTKDERQQWLQYKKVTTRDKETDEVLAEVIAKSDVSLGMTQNQVIQSWGDPELVEIAGNSLYKNERWQYTKFVPSYEGYKKQLRLLYFESGRLIGWELDSQSN